MAEQNGFSKPPKQYTGILIQQIPGLHSILQHTANTGRYRKLCTSSPCGKFLYVYRVQTLLFIFEISCKILAAHSTAKKYARLSHCQSEFEL